MLDMDLHKARLNAYKVGGKDGKVDLMKHNIINSFRDNISYHKVDINGLPRDVHIINAKGGKYRMLCLPDENIEVGDYIKWNELIYVCTSIEDNNEIQSSGEIQLCNNVLTLQDSETLKIHTTPCILDDKTSVYADGIYEGKLISLPDDQIMLTVANSEIAQKLTSDMKLVFNHNQHYIYKTKRIDGLTQEGLIFIRAVHELYNPNTDNLELNISTYVEPEKEPEPTPTPDPDVPATDNFTIEIKSTNAIAGEHSFTSTVTYTAIVKNGGVVVSNQPVTFELTDINMTNVELLSQDGASCQARSNDYNSGTYHIVAKLDSDVNVVVDEYIVMGW